MLILILDLQKDLKETLQEAQKELDKAKVSQSHSSCCPHKLFQSKFGDLEYCVTLCTAVHIWYIFSFFRHKWGPLKILRRYLWVLWSS